MNPLTALGVVSTVVAIVLFFGTVVVYLRGSADKGTIQTLKESNEALAEQVGILKSENAELKVRVTACEKENKRLAAERPSAEVLSAIRGDQLTFIKATTDALVELRAVLMALASNLTEDK